MTDALASETFDINFETPEMRKLAWLLFSNKPRLGKALQGTLGLSMEPFIQDTDVISITATPNIPTSKAGVAFESAQLPNAHTTQDEVKKVFDNLCALHKLVGSKLDKAHIKKACNLTEKGENALKLAMGEAANENKTSAETRRPAAALAAAAAQTTTDDLPSRGSFKPRRKSQLAFFDLIGEKGITFGLGAAGTGKTHVAIAKAFQMLHEKKIEKIILARPAVEAGEKLGYLPGTEKEKLEGYLQPLYDEAWEVLGNGKEKIGKEKLDGLMKDGIVNIIAIGKLRGRTLKKAFIIADECQNATWPQMKTIITRYGTGSRMVITGDPEQIDLPDISKSGLEKAANRLEKVEGFGVVRFGPEDIVRDELVMRAVQAFREEDALDQELMVQKAAAKKTKGGPRAAH